jgi:hypothetical protein|nr:MAG TPA: hypothetical protein [Caudoviricetes sp.]
MTIKELYEWAKENKSEDLPLSVRYWDIFDEGYNIQKIHLSNLDTDNVEMIIQVWS